MIIQIDNNCIVAMLSIEEAYQGKTVAVIGCKNTLGKVLLRKILVLTQLGFKIRNLILLDIRKPVEAKPPKLEDFFLEHQLFAGLDWDHLRQITSIVVVKSWGEDVGQDGQKLPHIDVMFNCLMPQDYTRCGVDQFLNSHVWRAKQICSFLKGKCSSIGTLITTSSLYCENPGYISETEILRNEQNELPEYWPPDSISPSQLKETLRDVFHTERDIWQWSVKFMEVLYSRTLSTTIRDVHHIIRVPQLGPTLTEYEGYHSNFTSLMNVFYEVGNGFIDRLEGLPNNVIDMVPVDYTVNYLLTVAVTRLPTHRVSATSDELGSNQDQPLPLRSEANHEGGVQHTISLHNFSTSTRNPVHLGTLSSYIVEAWREYSQSPARISLQVHSQKWQQNAYKVQKELPKAIRSRLAQLLDVKSWKIQAQQDQVLMAKKNEIIGKYRFYLSKEWICESNKSIDYFFSLSAQDQQRFHFNVNSINWRAYAKLCCYSVNKYLLGLEVEKFNPSSMDLLTMQKSSYFSDIMWALSEGKSVETQNSEDIKKYIMSTKSVKEAIRSLVEEQTAKLEKTPMAYQKVEQQFYRVGEEMCEQMFSQYSMKSIRAFAWFLHKVFRTIYEKVVIDKSAIMKLKSHNEAEKGPIIVIPTHRSYIDFLIMSYVFFGYGIRCPHIAAAEDFLNMAVVHILLRKSGAFFIKRNMRKNRVLYKAIMTEYISKLLGENHYLEFFIEGTRSRVGKMLAPKYGILSIVAKNVLDGRIPDAQILPITLNYEKVLEGESFTYEMMGQSKVKESLKRLIGAVDVLKENYGRIYVDFCGMISVKEYFAQNQKPARNPEDSITAGNKEDSITAEFESTLERLGYKIVHEMTSKLIITPPAILASVLLMNRIGISDDRLGEKVQWLCKEITSRGVKVARTQADSSISISTTLALLQDTVSKSRKDIFQVQVSFDQNSFKQLFTLTYYRNTLTHIFFEEALVAVSLATFGHQAMVTGTLPLFKLEESILFIGKLLNREFVLQNYVDQEGRIEEVLKFMAQKGVLSLDLKEGQPCICVTNPQSNLFSFYCSLVWPVVQSYWISCLYLFKLEKDSLVLPLDNLHSEIQWFGQSLFTERIILHLEAISMDTIKNAISQLISMGVIKGGSHAGKHGMKVVVGEQQLKALEGKISSYLKSKYAASLKGIIGFGQASSSVNLDFPFLPKL